MHGSITGSDQQKKVGTLSGGERNRVQLALMLKEGANVLLLDEPTNDLDVNTLRALEEGILAILPGASSWSATIAGSSTGSPRTSWPSRARAAPSGSRETSPSTRKTSARGSATPRSSRTGSSIDSSRVKGPAIQKENCCQEAALPVSGREGDVVLQLVDLVRLL